MILRVEDGGGGAWYAVSAAAEPSSFTVGLTLPQSGPLRLGLESSDALDVAKTTADELVHVALSEWHWGRDWGYRRQSFALIERGSD